MDLISELTNAKTQYAAANELFEQATAQATEAKAALEAKEKALADEQAKVANGAEALATKQAELDAKLAELSALAAKVAELKANEKTVEQKAIELVAAQGIAPTTVAISESSKAMNKAEALAAYTAISDPVARGQFYIDHREILVG